MIGWAHRALAVTPSVIALMLAGCGGSGSGSAGSGTIVLPGGNTAAPTPAPTPYASLNFSYEAHRFSSQDVVPSYTYAGVTYPGGLADIFPQASLSADFQGDGLPELVVPLNKAYGTPAYAALPYVLLSNRGGRLRYEASANAALPAVFGARRSASLTVGTNRAAVFVAHNVSGIYNDPRAHGTAVLLTNQDWAIAPDTQAIPRITTRSELPDHATDAHSMAVGDLNGDRLQDILIGNWNSWGGYPPTMLVQQPGGRFAIRPDTFFDQLIRVPMVNVGSTGNEGFNLLLDLHFVDVNGDGLDDLVAGFGHGSTPSFLFINRNGQFNFDERVALPPSVYGIDTNLHLETRDADIDNDGDKDLVIQHSRYVPYYGGNYLQILRNDGGSWTDISAVALEQDNGSIFAQRLEWSPDLFLRDLDRDGLIDIVFGLSNGTTAFFFNKGAGRFARLNANLPGNTAGRLLAVDDFDGNGQQELAFYQYFGSSTEKGYLINIYALSFIKP